MFNQQSDFQMLHAGGMSLQNPWKTLKFKMKHIDKANFILPRVAYPYRKDGDIENMLSATV